VCLVCVGPAIITGSYIRQCLTRQAIYTAEFSIF